jgi:hypothetical protein
MHFEFSNAKARLPFCLCTDLPQVLGVDQNALAVFKILGCHERETTQLRSQQARQNLLLQKGAPQRASTPCGESAGVYL